MKSIFNSLFSVILLFVVSLAFAQGSPSNDDASAPDQINPSVYGTSSGAVTGDLDGATGTGGQVDIWYTFTPLDKRQYFTFNTAAAIGFEITDALGAPVAGGLSSVTNGTEYVIDNLVSGDIYTLRVYSNASYSMPTPVEVNAANPCVIAGPDATICTNAKAGLFGLIDLATTGTWTKVSGLGSLNTANWDGVNGIEYTPDPNDVTVVMKLTGGAGCPQESTLTVNVVKSPSLSTVPPSPLCEGTAVALNPTATDANATGAPLRWFDNQVDADAGTSAIASTVTPPVGTNTYFAEMTTTDGCYHTAPVAVEVKALPNATVAPSSCGGADVTTSAASPSYLWSNGQTGASIAGVASGTYAVTVTANGCPKSLSVNVTCSLPVELISFTGKVRGRDNLLQWITATELNTAYFVLERSYDGFNFVEVARERATNTTVTHSYSKIDANAPNKAYYRLRIMDNDGTFAFSPNIIVLERTKTGSGFTNVYPNPTTTGLTVEFTANEASNVTFSLIDAIGQVLFTQVLPATEGDNAAQFDLSDFSSGVYFLQLDQAGAKRTVRKIIKE